MSVSKLRQGDYCPNGLGAFDEAAGAEELLERVLFKLSVHRGSFPLMPDLGSRLYLLPREKPSARQALAASYAAEALAGEEVKVIRAEWKDDIRHLTVWLEWLNQTLTASLTI